MRAKGGLQMRRVERTFAAVLPAVALIVIGIMLLAAPAVAQSCSDGSRPAASHSQRQSDEPVATSGNVFVGKIMKSGDKLVLASSDATYQLDDRQKALLFLRRTVKITGRLDPSTGIIHVGTIAPS
jgi:hypothetical protein